MGCKLMRTVIEEILTAHQALDGFNSPKTGSFWLKIGVGAGFMPLSIERHGAQITISHYFTMNGDLVPDPDVELRVGESGDWEPVAIQHSDGTYVYCEDEIQRQNLDSFVGLWARNLRAQGFAGGTIINREIE